MQFSFLVSRRLGGCNRNITVPRRRSRSSELTVKAVDNFRIGLINVGRGSEVRVVVELLPCVVNDTKRVDMGLNGREIVEGCFVKVVARWRL